MRSLTNNMFYLQQYNAPVYMHTYYVRMCYIENGEDGLYYYGGI